MRLVLLWLTLALSACATAGLRSPEVLLETDRAFAADAQEHGVQAAFTRFAAPDAWVLKAGGAARGRDAVQATFAGAGQVDLRWEPKGGELSEAGDVGFTWGTWSRRIKGEAGQPQTGRYLTTWRRTAEGYRWTADLGDSDPPPAPR
jgi:ketosteroid isomerase-like protein